MDDLATLNDVTGPAVLQVVVDRFHQRQYYTYFGDFLLSVNPCQPTLENESQVGHWYRNCKPLQELPPHVLALAHRAYQMLLTDFRPQAILLTGRSGSGKTHAAQSLVSQLMREARLSPLSGLGPRIVMAQHVLKTLVTSYCPGSPESTRSAKLTTLYSRPDGRIVSGEVCALCLDKWRLVDREPGSGAFTVLYAMLAGLDQVAINTYYLTDFYRILDRSDGGPVFFGPEDHGRHVEIFDFFMTSLEQLGLDVPTSNYAGQQMSAILAALAAILHLGNVQMTTHAQTGQTVIVNHHELRAAADLLSVRQDQLEAELLYDTHVVRGEVARVGNTADQASWRRDCLLVELYRRLVSVLTGSVCRALMPHPGDVDHAALTPLSVIEAPAYDDRAPTSRLETFLRNMAAERIQRHLHDVIFQRDVEACEREHVEAYKIKYNDNAELIHAVFKPDGGILASISMATSDSRGSPQALVASLDKDKALKKTGCYVSSGRKGGNIFVIQHSANKVTYDASDFLSKNHGLLPEGVRRMLLHSGNPLVARAAAVTFQPSGYPPEYLQPESFYASSSLQSDMAFFLQRVEGSHLHYVRCLRPNSLSTPSGLDQTELTSQLKEACVVEAARQRKFGYSVCMTQQEFVTCFRTLAFSSSATLNSLPQACEMILERSSLQGRGPLVTKTSVFLRYWHVQRLHALKAEDMRRIVVAQSAVRRFLVRRRLRGRVTSQQQAAAVGQFCDYVSQAGQWAYRTVQGQADEDRNRFEGELRHAIDRGHQHHHVHPNINNNHAARDPYTGERFDNDGDRYLDNRFSSSMYGSERSSVVLSDQEMFYDEVVERILASQDSLSENTWAKIIYMERGRQVAKAYVESRAIIVDGSTGAFDGDRFGLGACRNEQRDEETAFHRAHIEEGVRLKRDPDGNVWACRLTDHPIVVKGLENPDVGGMAADVIICRGKLPQDQTIKIFDIMEFRSKVALDLKQGRFSRSRLRRACVIGLSFGRDDVRDLDTACWLCVVNVKALLALDSDDIIREAQLRTAQLEMTSPEEEDTKLAEDDARARMSRSRWAKTDQRDHLQAKEAGSRHIRQQLRAKGKAVGDHLGYSWENSSRGEKTTMEAVQQWVEPELYTGRSRGSGHVRSWAKVETAIREERNRAPVQAHTDEGLGPAPDYD